MKKKEFINYETPEVEVIILEPEQVLMELSGFDKDSWDSL